MGRVIALANQKGGVAKTTSTLNLAVAFAEEGHRVLAVDLDPQGNLTMSQGLNPDTIERSMYDVLVHKLPIEQIIHRGEIAGSTSIARDDRIAEVQLDDMDTRLPVCLCQLYVFRCGESCHTADDRLAHCLQFWD